MLASSNVQLPVPPFDVVRQPLGDGREVTLAEGFVDSLSGRHIAHADSLVPTQRNSAGSLPHFDGMVGHSLEASSGTLIPGADHRAGADVLWSDVSVDGVHDLGGMQGFGPVEVEADEPVFHADWERRAFRLTISALMAGHLNGRFRHSIERMDPIWYLASPYYEHWLTATATGLVEGGLITQEELDGRLGAPYPISRGVRAPRLEASGPSVERHRYGVGTAVRVREWHPLGHTRAPRYVQGKPGVVVRLDGVFSVPDVEYHCHRVRLEPTYSVRFEAADLWGSPGDPVHVDLWESYLEPGEAPIRG